MAKTRTIEEEITYLNHKISREKKLCENLENVYIPEAKKDYSNVSKFENSNNAEERKLYLYAAHRLAMLNSELTNKKLDIFFDKERVHQLQQELANGHQPE